MHIQQDTAVRILMPDPDQRAVFERMDAQFLAQFPGKTVDHRFLGLELAARKLPQAALVGLRVAPLQQDAATFVDQCGSRDMDESRRARSGTRH